MFKDFVHMSQHIGKDLFYIQGAGGNTSVKTSNTHMIIKASGFLLKNVTTTTGYSIVSYPQVLKTLDMQSLDNTIFAQQMNACVMDTENRPSIETALHALLPKKYIIHTHSVWVNIITCSEQGKSIAQALFPKSLWIPYETPGLDLCQSLKSHLQQSGHAPVIFLQNHGIFVSADTSEQALQIHAQVNKIILQHFDITPTLKDFDLSIFPLDFITDNIIFPDQVVFSMGDAALRQTTYAQETLWAYSFIIKTINDLGLDARCLCPMHADILLSMESEKYRQQQALQNR